ncbi:MAG: hypothetical protein FJX76_11500 [Armatimonadetes bacterium]|nr:hypothetical protein [Armatimonadota bacterium]
MNTVRNTNVRTTGTSNARQSAPQNSERPGAPKSKDTVTLSAQAQKSGETNKVDRDRQEQEVSNQERELEENPRENTRPANGDDADNYNRLVSEAASYPAGTHETENGSVTVSEENGVKTLRFSEGSEQRKVIVDGKTGDASESIVKPAFKNGPNYLLQSVTSYDRRGDLLGPVFEDNGATVPFGTGASFGPPQIYSTAPQPRPQPQGQSSFDIQMVLANMQGQGTMAYRP